MAITNGQSQDANDVRNIKTYNFDCELRPSGQRKIYIHIDNVSGVRNVWLYLYGETSELPIVEHRHHLSATDLLLAGVSWADTDNDVSIQIDSIKNQSSAWVQSYVSVHHTLATSGGSALTDVIPGTSVPQAVQIWIDGTQYTATIGDPNGKGATMYDSVNNDWGVDGTTIWNTGKLNLTSVISWTAGEHYIEFKETGGTGGRLLASIYINNLS